MHNSNLSKNTVERQAYESPVCNEIFVGTQRVICGSDPVPEYNGFGLEEEM